MKAVLLNSNLEENCEIRRKLGDCHHKNSEHKPHQEIRSVQSNRLGADVASEFCGCYFWIGSFPFFSSLDHAPLVTGSFLSASTVCSVPFFLQKRNFSTKSPTEELRNVLNTALYSFELRCERTDARIYNAKNSEGLQQSLSRMQ